MGRPVRRPQPEAAGWSGYWPPSSVARTSAGCRRRRRVGGRSSPQAQHVQPVDGQPERLALTHPGPCHERHERLQLRGHCPSNRLDLPRRRRHHSATFRLRKPVPSHGLYHATVTDGRLEHSRDQRMHDADGRWCEGLRSTPPTSSDLTHACTSLWEGWTRAAASPKLGMRVAAALSRRERGSTVGAPVCPPRLGVIAERDATSFGSTYWPVRTEVVTSSSHFGVSLLGKCLACSRRA